MPRLVLGARQDRDTGAPPNSFAGDCLSERALGGLIVGNTFWFISPFLIARFVEKKWRFGARVGELYVGPNLQSVSHSVSPRNPFNRAQHVAICIWVFGKWRSVRVLASDFLAGAKSGDLKKASKDKVWTVDYIFKTLKAV